MKKTLLSLLLIIVSVYAILLLGVQLGLLSSWLFLGAIPLPRGAAGFIRLIVILTIGGFLWWLRRRPVIASHAANAPWPDWRTRILETLVIAIVSFGVLAVMACSSSSGGRLARLSNLPPDQVRVYVGILAASAALLVIGLVLSLFGRTSLSICLTAIALSGHCFLTESSKLFPPFARSDPPQLIITLGDCDVVGAEVRINGVYLGKTPLKLSFDELSARIPHWNEPSKAENRIPVRVQNIRAPWENYTHFRNRWSKLDLTQARSLPSSPQGSNRDEVYCEFRYAGEVGGGGGFGGGSANYGPYWFRADVEFPQRQKRLDTLLNQARLADYKAGPPWFQAMETFHSDGWIALRKCFADEPQMRSILDDWAMWRYGFKQSPDADAAWRAFESICDEADSTGRYISGSVPGRAVELLVPHLPPERLVSRAEGLLRSVRLVSYSSTDMVDGGIWGMAAETSLHHWPLQPQPSESGHLSPGGFAVAHAVWKLDQLLDANGKAGPNIVEARVTPALIRVPWAIDYAIRLGGPDLDRFLLRQDWQADPNRMSFENTVYKHGKSVNRWLYMLANLRDPAGKQFRAQHPRELFALAADLLQHTFAGDIPDFLFLDLEQGSRSLAAQFWPQFQACVSGWTPYRVVDVQWKYLLRMEPISTVDDYVQVWRRATREQRDQCWYYAIEKLTDPKRRQVIDALADEIQRNFTPEQLNQLENTEWEGEGRLLRQIWRWQSAHSPQAEAEQVVAELRKPPNKRQHNSLSDFWLERVPPDHPIITMLAGAKEPELRTLVLCRPRACPTPANRRLLDTLLRDSDAAVRQAAERVRAELDQLAATPSSAFVSDPAASQP